MYEQFFGLSEKPFSIQPDPAFLYWGRTHRLAYAMLEYGVLNHAGISVITGEVGCGKTTLVHRLLDQLSDTHTVALLSNIQQGRGDLLSWVLMGFGEPFANKTHVELFSHLQSFFISEYSKGRRVVLIIDEAQNLSADMLEELRMLSNINAGKDQLLQLILVGQPQLKELLNKPELLQLAQRVGSDFHLTPLNVEEVHAYIDTRLAIAGCRRRVFTDRAIDSIAEHSRGVPRVINIITDTALVYAFSAEELVVGVETIRNVIRDKSEFGVFGLASDEAAAPPLRPASEAGIDAFADSSKKNRRNDADEATPAERDDRRPQSPPQNEPLEGQQRDHDVIVDVAPRAGGQMREASPRFSGVKEQSSITGVVVVASDNKTSPEAAIRSAGDGRAIVFVAVGGAPDATAIAKGAGAVIAEGPERSFTPAGRARNAGYRQLKKIAPHLQYVQFVDAQTALDPDWITTAEKFMARRPEVSIVTGTIRPPPGLKISAAPMGARDHGDDEGEIQCVFGGSALMRVESFEAAGGFRGDLLTAETVDLCIRLRRRGARIWRLGEGMALCEPAPKSGGWWAQGRQRGFDNAYCASLHGGPPERIGILDTVLAVLWGFLFPTAVVITALLGAFVATKLSPATPPMLVAGAILAFGAGVFVFRMAASVVVRGVFRASSWRAAFPAVMGRFPEFLGACKLWFGAKR
jgi:general secretion pathway protein A